MCVALVASTATVISCSSSERTSASENVRAQRTAIAGGAEADAPSAVFSLQARYASTSRRCTAFLIAPNLFLTARHCLVASDAALTCDTPFPELVEPAALDFTNPTRVDSVEAETTPVYHGAIIHVPPGNDSLCGGDLALVMTDEALDIEPLAPQLEGSPAPGDEYSAVGYGLLGELIGGEGTRRSRNGLQFECDTPGCAPTLVDGEILGEDAPCEGDSGGPAIAADGRAAAVLSRGTASCETPIYITLFAHREWLREVAKEAAVTGNYPLPDWAQLPAIVAQGGAPSAEGGAGGKGGESPIPSSMGGEPASVPTASAEDPGCSCALPGEARRTERHALLLTALFTSTCSVRRFSRKLALSRSTSS